MTGISGQNVVKRKLQGRSAGGLQEGKVQVPYQVAQLFLHHVWPGLSHTHHKPCVSDKYKDPILPKSHHAQLRSRSGHFGGGGGGGERGQAGGPNINTVLTCSTYFSRCTLPMKRNLAVKKKRKMNE